MVQSIEDSLLGHRTRQKKVEIDVRVVENNWNNRDFNFFLLEVEHTLLKLEKHCPES